MPVPSFLIGKLTSNALLRFHCPEAWGPANGKNSVRGLEKTPCLTVLCCYSDCAGQHTKLRDEAVCPKPDPTLLRTSATPAQLCLVSPI